MRNQKFIIMWYTLASALLLSGCAHPYLKAGGSLATSIKQGDLALAKLSESEANTQRVYRYVQLAYGNLEILNSTDLPSEFVGEVCRPHDEDVLVSERIALGNFDKYQGYLEVNATDPKDQSLAALITSLSSTGSLFQPNDADKAITEYKAKQRLAQDACTADVRNTFVASAQAESLTGAVILSAWPKLKSFFTMLLVEENKAAREGAIVESLKNVETQQALDDSLRELDRSATTGALSKLATSQKQLALWAAYADFKMLKEIPRTFGLKKLEAFQKTNEVAKSMAANMNIYNDLAVADPKEVISKMKGALEKLRIAARSGAKPDDSLYAELFAALDFLSDVSDKYSSASSALLGNASSKK